MSLQKKLLMGTLATALATAAPKCGDKPAAVSSSELTMIYDEDPHINSALRNLCDSHWTTEEGTRKKIESLEDKLPPFSLLFWENQYYQDVRQFVEDQLLGKSKGIWNHDGPERVVQRLVLPYEIVLLEKTAEELEKRYKEGLFVREKKCELYHSCFIPPGKLEVTDYYFRYSAKYNSSYDDAERAAFFYRLTAKAARQLWPVASPYETERETKIPKSLELPLTGITGVWTPGLMIPPQLSSSETTSSKKISLEGVPPWLLNIPKFCEEFPPLCDSPLLGTPTQIVMPLNHNSLLSCLETQAENSFEDATGKNIAYSAAKDALKDGFKTIVKDGYKKLDLTAKKLTQNILQSVGDAAFSEIKNAALCWLFILRQPKEVLWDASVRILDIQEQYKNLLATMVVAPNSCICNVPEYKAAFNKHIREMELTIRSFLLNDPLMYKTAVASEVVPDGLLLGPRNWSVLYGLPQDKDYILYWKHWQEKHAFLKTAPTINDKLIRILTDSDSLASLAKQCARHLCEENEHSCPLDLYQDDLTRLPQSTDVLLSRYTTFDTYGCGFNPAEPAALSVLTAVRGNQQSARQRLQALEKVENGWKGNLEARAYVIFAYQALGEESKVKEHAQKLKGELKQRELDLLERMRKSGFYMHEQLSSKSEVLVGIGLYYGGFLTEGKKLIENSYKFKFDPQNRRYRDKILIATLATGLEIIGKEKEADEVYRSLVSSLKSDCWHKRDYWYNITKDKYGLYVPHWLGPSLPGFNSAVQIAHYYVGRKLLPYLLLDKEKAFKK